MADTPVLLNRAKTGGQPNESFTEEQRANFEQYLSVSADLLDANTLDSFITGFRLGAHFMHETFLGTDAPFAELTMDES